jgi:hypothetical protein
MPMMKRTNKGASMETPYELIHSTSVKVEDFLKVNFPDYITFDEHSFTIEQGSTIIMIKVRPYTNEDTIIECVATVVVGANITPDLMNFLLRKNAELHFGAFGLLFDGTIVFTYSIAGKNVDNNELDTAIKSVAIIADYYDNEIINLAGGKTAIEAEI